MHSWLEGLTRVALAIFYANFARDASSTWQTAKLGCQDDPAQQVRQGRLTVTVILSDLLLFFSLAAFYTGIVLAVASLLG